MYVKRRTTLTSCDLRIYLDPRICRDPRLRQLNSLVNRNSNEQRLEPTPQQTLLRSGDLPLTDDSIMFHTVRNTLGLKRTGDADATHLLMLSIRSIFLIPSQWRMSGINAWKRMSLTPAIFSVRLKYSDARSAPRFLAL